MKSDNLVQLSGFLTKDVITNETKSFVLSSIDAYKKEGDTLHHCVFTNTYYDRKNSLILAT